MIYDRIKELCKAKGVTVAKLEQDLELGRSSIRKMDKHDPGVGKLSMIAGYLGVTVDALLDDDYYAPNGIARIAQQMYDDPDMREIYQMKKEMTEERFALYKKLLEEMYRAEHAEGGSEQ